MKHSHLIAVATIAASLSGSTIAFATEIHKCAGRGSVSYQTEACASGQRQLALLTIESSAPPADMLRSGSRDDANARGTANGSQPFRGRQWLPYERRSIVPGMTDDEVLNSAAGGVPTRITRSRDGRTWRETWIYETRAGAVRAMQFVNGRLASMEEGADMAEVRLAGSP